MKKDTTYLIGYRCRDCIYLGSLNSAGGHCCDYFLKTGKLRPDEPIARCSVRVRHELKLPPLPLLSIFDVAELFDMSDKTLRGWMYDAGIKSKTCKGFGKIGFMTVDDCRELYRIHGRLSDLELPERIEHLRQMLLAEAAG